MTVTKIAAGPLLVSASLAFVVGTVGLLASIATISAIGYGLMIVLVCIALALVLADVVDLAIRWWSW